MSDVISLSIQGEIAVLKIENPPVNALSSAVRTELVDTVETMIQGDQIAAIVIVGDGRCFSAGADISEFGTTPPPGTPTLPETIATLENAPIPVVVGLHGFVLGGGLEIAMGAHYRIATPDTKLGLPEVDIGIIPGAGGTQRLPRLIGIKAAAHMVATATKITGEEAAELGLVDIVTDTDDIEASTIAFAETLIDQGLGPRPTPMITDRIETPDEAKVAVEEVRAFIAKKVGGRQAPARALDSVLNAASMSFDDGMAAEREIFLDLRDGPEARALRHLFKAERNAQKIPDVADEFKAPTITSAGVVGMGTMGQGITLVLARAGIEVTAIEVNEERLDGALNDIKSALEDRVARGRMTQDQMDDELSRITRSTDYAALTDADLVIEAALEDMSIKKQIFAELDAVCPPHAILTTNTSSLDIDDIASATGRPDQVVGAHFFAPAQVMKLLEIVRGKKTSAETAATMMSLAKRIGKVGVAVSNKINDPEVAELIKSVADELETEHRDSASQDIQDRCLFALINKGARLIEKGTVARASDIDVIWRYGYGFPIWRGGPMFMADEMGLPAVLKKLETLASKHGPAFEATDLIRDRVAEGKSTFAD